MIDRGYQPQAYEYIPTIVGRAENPLPAILMTVGLSEAFRKRGVNLFYYYAPIQNVRGILERGILCKNLIRSLGVKAFDLSLGSIQKRRSLTRVGNRPLHDYVPLFMQASSPMFEERLRQLGDQVACFVVSTNVCEQEGVYFSDGNAAYAELGTRFYSSSQDVRLLPWFDIKAQAGYNRTRGAEVLVPLEVQVRYFRYVMVEDPNKPQVREFLPELPAGVQYKRFDSTTVFREYFTFEGWLKLLSEKSKGE